MNGKIVSTVVFVVVVGGVLTTFAVLGGQARPPSMPAAPQHKLRFNLKGELTGVESDPAIDKLAPRPDGFKYNERAEALRISVGCTACHGGLVERTDPDGRKSTDMAPCPNQPSVKCVGDHHPPKNECIKCHTMAKSAPASASATAPTPAPGGGSAPSPSPAPTPTPPPTPRGGSGPAPAPRTPATP